MKICSACGHVLKPEGPCGFASVTFGENTTYLCHADDHSCYMGAAADTGKVTSSVRDLAASSDADSSRPSPGADPRIEAVIGEPSWRDFGTYKDWAEWILAAADAADRAAGIVRVDADRLTDALLKASETTDSTTLYPSWVEGYAGTLAERVVAALRGEQP